MSKLNRNTETKMSVKTRFIRCVETTKSLQLVTRSANL